MLSYIVWQSLPHTLGTVDGLFLLTHGYIYQADRLHKAAKATVSVKWRLLVLLSLELPSLSSNSLTRTQWWIGDTGRWRVHDDWSNFSLIFNASVNLPQHGIVPSSLQGLRVVQPRDCLSILCYKHMHITLFWTRSKRSLRPSPQLFHTTQQ